MRSTDLTVQTARSVSEAFIGTIEPYPGHCGGCGIVVCAGGLSYLTTAWVCINLLRQQGCRLPIQLWHLNERELDDRIRSLLAPLDVDCIDASRKEVASGVALNGWSLKSFALLRSGPLPTVP